MKEIDVDRDGSAARRTVKGRIAITGAVVEISEIEWDRPGWVSSGSDHVLISQLISPLKGDRRLRWYDLDHLRPLTVSQFGVQAPGSPLLIAHGPGSACFLICRIEAARFRTIAGSDKWPHDWTLRGLTSESPFFHALLDRLTGEVLHPHPDSARFVEALVTAFVLELGRAVRSRGTVRAVRGGLADWQLDRVRRLVAEAGARAPTIAEMARRCGISPRQLTRGWRQSEGTTLHQQFAEARLARARALLTAGKMPLKVVAVEAGFANPSHFAASFRRAIGCSPSQYRASVRTASTS